MHLLLLIQITATLYTAVYQSHKLLTSSWSRMPLPDFYRKAIKAIISLPFKGLLTGCQSNSELILKFSFCTNPFITKLPTVQLNCCILTTPLKTVRSSYQNLLLVPYSRLKRREDRAFSVLEPQLWNNLPLEIRLAPSLLIFKSLSLFLFFFFLKKHLFSLAFYCCVFFCAYSWIFIVDLCLVF